MTARDFFSTSLTDRSGGHQSRGRRCRNPIADDARRGVGNLAICAVHGDGVGAAVIRPARSGQRSATNTAALSAVLGATDVVVLDTGQAVRANRRRYSKRKRQSAGGGGAGRRGTVKKKTRVRVETPKTIRRVTPCNNTVLLRNAPTPLAREPSNRLTTP